MKITISPKTLKLVLAALKPIAGTDPHRPLLHYINVKSTGEDNVVRFEALDGFKLMRIDVHADTIDEPGEMFLPADLILPKAVLPLVLATDGREWVVQSSFGAGSLRGALPEESWLATDTVLPEPSTTGCHRLWVNPKLYSSVLSSIHLFRQPKMPSLPVALTNGKTPASGIRLDAETDEVKIVAYVLPLRAQEGA